MDIIVHVCIFFVICPPMGKPSTHRGDYPNQQEAIDGLPLWTQKDRPLDGRDLVLWHVFGVTHSPRLEVTLCVSVIIVCAAFRDFFIFIFWGGDYMTWRHIFG
jgi:hypothetical protein